MINFLYRGMNRPYLAIINNKTEGLYAPCFHQKFKTK